MKQRRFARLRVAGFVILCFVAAPVAAGASPGTQPIISPSMVGVHAHLMLAPSRAAPGASIKARISGFKAFEYVNFRWMSPAGPLFAATVMADSSGRAVRFATVPSATPGTYTVYAVGLAGGPTATAALTVT
jgi:hypothetical protein